MLGFMNFPELYCERGDNHAKQKEYNLAIADYSKAIESCSNSRSDSLKSEEFYYKRGIAYTELGQNVKAIADFIMVVKLVMKFPFRICADETPYYDNAIVELKNQLYNLQPNVDLSEIPKSDLIIAIKKLHNIEDKKKLLRQCLDKNTQLGSYMWKPKNIFTSAIVFFGYNPEDYEFIRCDYNKGNLKIICDCLEEIDDTFTSPNNVIEMDDGENITDPFYNSL